jgi:hypothetical protein
MSAALRIMQILAASRRLSSGGGAGPLPTFDTLLHHSTYTLSNSNGTATMNAVPSTSDGYASAFGGQAVSTGKYVFRIQTPSVSVGTNMGVGIAFPGASLAEAFADGPSGYAMAAFGGYLVGPNGTLSDVDAPGYGNNSLIDVAFDATNGNLWIGAPPGSGDATVWARGGDPVAGTNPSFTGIPASAWVPGIYNDNPGSGGFFVTPLSLAGFSPWPGASETTLDSGSGYTSPHIILSNGNATALRDGSANQYYAAFSSSVKSTGKWYASARVETTLGSTVFGFAAAASLNLNNYPGGYGSSWGAATNGSTYGAGGNQVIAGFPAATKGSHIYFAVDIDAGKMWFGVDQAWNTGGDPETGASPIYTFTPNTPIVPGIGLYYGSDSATFAPLVSALPAGFQFWTP